MLSFLYGIEDNHKRWVIPAVLASLRIYSLFLCPTDQSGKSFSEPEGFIPRMFLSELEDLSKAFMQVESQLK